MSLIYDLLIKDIFKASNANAWIGESPILNQKSLTI